MHLIFLLNNSYKTLIGRNFLKAYHQVSHMITKKHWKLST